MKYLSLLLITLAFLITFPTTIQAATFRSDESIYISENETDLEDLYLFGDSITTDAQIINDLVAAGSNITLNGDITGSVIAAGATLNIRSNVGNTARVAGGNVAISGPIARDLIIAGGNVYLTNEASISGDLIIFGSEVNIEAPVGGKVTIYGENVTINNTVNGDVQGHISQLTLGKNAVIGGNLVYKSTERAKHIGNPVIHGKETFTQIEKQSKDSQRDSFRKVFTTAALYKLIVDILTCLALIAFLPLFIKKVLEKVTNKPGNSIGTGILFIGVAPLVSLFLLFLILPGILGFVFIAFIMLLSLFIGKIVTGWLVLNWWYKRQKKEYILDWKSALVGPFLVFVLLIIPIIGWIAVCILYLLTLGATIKALVVLINKPHSEGVVKK